MQVFFDKAYGYVVFPSVGKGGFIVVERTVMPGCMKREYLLAVPVLFS
jgi:hypothetical protein